MKPKDLKQPKILFYDIETSLINLEGFHIYSSYHRQEDIVQDWFILCVAWKWADSPKIYSVKANCKTRNDRKPVEAMVKALNQADIVVHHNGAKFDYPRIRTRAIYHDISPLPKVFDSYNSVDTCKAAKAELGLSANNLDYIAKYFDLPRKHHVEKELWRKINRLSKGWQAAFNEMVYYNKQDVLVLEAVYNKLKTALIRHPNVALMQGRPDGCERCGHTQLRAIGVRYTKQYVYRRYVCLSCGAYRQGKRLPLLELQEGPR